MRSKAIVTILVTIVLLSFSSIALSVRAQELQVIDPTGPTPPPPTFNPGIELCYDDGSAEQFYGYLTAGGILAVRFTPTFTPCLVDTLVFYGELGGAGNLRVHVLDSSQVDMITPFEITPTGGWNTVYLSSYNIIVTGDFYLALEWTQGQAYWLGMDYGSPQGRSYWGIYGNLHLWPPLGSGYPDGNWLLRAVIMEAPGGVIPEYPLGTILGVVMCIAALTVYSFKRVPIHLERNRIQKI